jgi:hypothetical protein
MFLLFFRALSRKLSTDVIATPSRALERAQKQSDPHRAPSVLCVHRPSLLSELMSATTGTRAVLEERTLDFEICTVNFEIFHLNNHDKVKQRKVNTDAKSNVGF